MSRFTDYLFPKKRLQSKLPLLPKGYSSTESIYGDPHPDMDEHITTLQSYSVARTKHDAHRVLRRHGEKPIEDVLKAEKRHRRRRNPVKLAWQRLLQLFGLAALLVTLAATQPAHAAVVYLLQFPDGTALPIIEAPFTGTTWDVSRMGYQKVAHLSGTSEPGSGNTVIGGHTPGPFNRLRGLMPGDQIVLVWSGETHHYQVIESELLTIDHVEVTLTPDDQYSYLTLLTCDDQNQRLVVKAIEVVT